jgi:hypothetical protein
MRKVFQQQINLFLAGIFIMTFMFSGCYQFSEENDASNVAQNDMLGANASKASTSIPDSGELTLLTSIRLHNGIALHSRYNGKYVTVADESGRIRVNSGRITGKCTFNVKMKDGLYTLKSPFTNRYVSAQPNNVLWAVMTSAGVNEEFDFYPMGGYYCPVIPSRGWVGYQPSRDTLELGYLGNGNCDFDIVNVEYQAKVCIISAATNRYVSQGFNSQGKPLPLMANKTSCGNSEIFDILYIGQNDQGKSLIALRSYGNSDKYVCADSFYDGYPTVPPPLVANREVRDAWETYELIDLGGQNTMALKSLNWDSPKYVSVDTSNSNYFIYAKSGSIGDSESFYIFQLN